MGRQHIQPQKICSNPYLGHKQITQCTKSKVFCKNLSGPSLRFRKRRGAGFFNTSHATVHECPIRKKRRNDPKFCTLYREKVAFFSSDELEKLIGIVSQFQNEKAKHIIMRDIGTVFANKMSYCDYFRMEKTLFLLQDQNINMGKVASQAIIKSAAVRLRFDTNVFSFINVAHLLHMLFCIARKKQGLKDLVEHIKHYAMQKKTVASSRIYASIA